MKLFVINVMLFVLVVEEEQFGTWYFYVREELVE